MKCQFCHLLIPWTIGLTCAPYIFGKHEILLAFWDVTQLEHATGAPVKVDYKKLSYRRETARQHVFLGWLTDRALH